MTISLTVREAMQAGSWIRRMFELGQELKRQHGSDKVFDLSLGNPLLEPPQAFSDELRRLVNEPTLGMHRYMPNAGYPETRAAIATHVSGMSGISFGAGNVVMTCGAGGALNVIFKALLDPGDEVICFAPYFPEYPFYVANHRGVFKAAPSDEAFQPDLQALKTLLTPNTKAVLVNSPNNPSGAVYPPSVLQGLADLLAQAEKRFNKQIYLIGDEPYARLIFDGLNYPYLYRFHRSTLVATSFSKDLSLPGERIGYVAVGPECPYVEEVVDALIFCNRVLGFVNAPALMQQAIKVVLEATVDVGWYQRRRDLVYANLSALGYQLVKPQGAFYAFPRSPKPDDVAFVQELLQWNVLVTPGSGFGCPGYFRISYSVEEQVLQGAMEGFSAAAKVYGINK